MTAAEDGRTAPLSVLFVCTANISRSAYAERRAVQLLDGAPLIVGSAGIPGYPGRGMDPEMAAQLRSRGCDPHGHVSRSLTRELVEDADVVLTFEFAHRMRIFEAWPDAAPKVLGLHQFTDAIARVTPEACGLVLLEEARRVSAPDSMTWDVEDPYRRGTKAARRCADEIDTILATIIPALSRVGL